MKYEAMEKQFSKLYVGKESKILTSFITEHGEQTMEVSETDNTQVISGIYYTNMQKVTDSSIFINAEYSFTHAQATQSNFVHIYTPGSIHEDRTSIAQVAVRKILGDTNFVLIKDETEFDPEITMYEVIPQDKLLLQ